MKLKTLQLVVAAVQACACFGFAMLTAQATSLWLAAICGAMAIVCGIAAGLNIACACFGDEGLICDVGRLGVLQDTQGEREMFRHLSPRQRPFRITHPSWVLRKRGAKSRNVVPCLARKWR
jgi:hypothetical protein